MSNGGMIKNSISQVVIDPINFIIRKKKEIKIYRGVYKNCSVHNFHNVRIRRCIGSNTSHNDR